MMIQQHGDERIIEFAYSTQEMLVKIQQVRNNDPYGNNHIYVFAKESSEFNALKRDSNISIYKPGGMRNHVISLFTKENPVEKGLRKLNLKDSERQEYLSILNNGGIIIVSGFDPFVESPLNKSYIERQKDYTVQQPRGPLATLLFGQHNNVGQALPFGLYPDITKSPYFINNTTPTGNVVKMPETVTMDEELVMTNDMAVAGEFGEKDEMLTDAQKWMEHNEAGEHGISDPPPNNYESK